MAATEGDLSSRPSTVPWPPLLLAACAIAAFALGAFAPVTWPGLNDWAADAVGAGIGLAGLALTIWGGVTLTRAKTTVLPHRGASHLVTTGPFAWRRNPIYLGDIMMLLGAAELTQNIWFVAAAAAFGGLVTWLAIIPEERHLAAKFGDAWRDYAARTRRMF